MKQGRGWVCWGGWVLYFKLYFKQGGSEEDSPRREHFSKDLNLVVVGVGVGLHVSRRRRLQVERTKGKCKCPRKECAWCIQGIARR